MQKYTYKGTSLRYSGKPLIRKAKKKATPRSVQKFKRMTNPKNAFKLSAASKSSGNRGKKKATISSTSFTAPPANAKNNINWETLASKAMPRTNREKGLFGCLGCLGLILVLFIGSAIIAGIAEAIGGSDEGTNQANRSAQTSLSATPTPATVPTSDENGQIFDAASDESTIAGENPLKAVDAVSAVSKDTVEPATAAQGALDKLNSLEVKGRAPKTGYDRALFGRGWIDVDRNGCDTRNDMLRRDLISAQTKPGTRGCVVLTGTLNDPYTGNNIRFQRGRDTSEAIQIDHVVALSDAWQKGAQSMNDTNRIEFANDPINLLSVDGPTNQKKGDGDAATWLPPQTSYRCEYVSKQIDVKAKYGLWVTQAEKTAMTDVLTAPECGAKVETPKPTPTVTQQEVAPAPAEEQAPAPAPVEEAPAPAPAVQEPAHVAPAPLMQNPAPAGGYFANCTQAHEAGRYDIPASDPAYRPALDRNNDGVACESK